MSGKGSSRNYCQFSSEATSKATFTFMNMANKHAGCIMYCSSVIDLIVVFVFTAYLFSIPFVWICCNGLCLF